MNEQKSVERRKGDCWFSRDYLMFCGVVSLDLE